MSCVKVEFCVELTYALTESLGPVHSLIDLSEHS